MIDIAAFRLHNQQLTQQEFKNPGEVVGWMGAMQAQEYALAKWALGLRLPGLKDADIEQAFTDGSILRTHVMRPTWHFVTPADIRWILALTAPRVHALNAYMYRKLELDAELLLRSNTVIAKTLEGGKQLTRAELALALGQAGIVAEGMRLGYIVMNAELDAIICSGARRGKQFTWALLDERAPQAITLTRDEALAELVKRFFSSHGPAMVHDFAWWSGLTIADTKAGLEMCKPQLMQEEINGRMYWFSSSIPDAKSASGTAYLLPPYDEYGIGYKDHSAILDPAHMEQIADGSRTFTAFYAIQGQFAGMWKRTFNKGGVVIDTRPFRSLTPAENTAFAAAAQRFGEFLGMPVAQE